MPALRTAWELLYIFVQIRESNLGEKCTRDIPWKMSMLKEGKRVWTGLLPHLPLWTVVIQTVFAISGLDPNGV